MFKYRKLNYPYISLSVILMLIVCVYQALRDWVIRWKVDYLGHVDRK